LVLLVQVLAILACCIGGAMGGYVLAHPDDAMGMVGLQKLGPSSLGVGQARAFGATLLASHAGAAAALGYSPRIGAAMAMALSLMWLGAACGRGVAMSLEPPVTRPGRSLLLLDILMGLSLSLPLLLATRYVGGGGVVV
jgi:hypothetical protein